MATIRKRHNRYQAQVRIGLHSISASFDTRPEARAWAAGEEAKILSARKTHDCYKPSNMAEVIHRYMAVVSPHKKTYTYELIVLGAMLKEPWTIVPFDHLGAGHLAEYRVRRLKTIKATSFNRQFCIIRHACKIAKTEWGWAFNDEFLSVRKAPEIPAQPVKRLKDVDLEKLLKASEICRNSIMKYIITLAVETGMRRSELCAITRANIDLVQGVILVLETKNGHPRSIPLTKDGHTAVKILLAYSKGDCLVDMTPNAIRLSFERIRSRAGLRQIKFHHLRHEALSRFFEMGLTPPEVASISGHRTFKQLMRYSHAMEDRIKRIVQGQ